MVLLRNNVGGSQGSNKYIKSDSKIALVKGFGNVETDWNVDLELNVKVDMSGFWVFV